MPTAGDSYQDSYREGRDVDCQTPLLKGSVPKPTATSKRIALLFQNWWLWEIVSAGTAVLAVVVIIITPIFFRLGKTEN